MPKCEAVAVGRPLATSADVEGYRHPVWVPHVLACSPTIGHLARPHRRELIRRRTSHGFEVPIGYACGWCGSGAIPLRFRVASLAIRRRSREQDGSISPREK